MRGVASQIGVDVFRGWRFSFDYTRRPEPGHVYDEMEHGALFTLTPTLAA